MCAERWKGVDLLLAPAPFKIVVRRKLQIKYLLRNRHQWPAPASQLSVALFESKVEETANLTILMVFFVYFQPFKRQSMENSIENEDKLEMNGFLVKVIIATIFPLQDLRKAKFKRCRKYIN